jgi:hypothetical protein
MSHSDDEKGGKKKPQQSPAGPESEQSDKRSGRVAFDSRGNPIWEWQLETGVYSRDVTTQKLKKLDLGGLSIADSGIHPQPSGSNPSPTKAPAPPKPAVTGKSTPANSQAASQRSAPGSPQGSSQGSSRGSSKSPADSGGFNPYDSGNRDTGNRNAGSGGGIDPYDSQGRPAGAGTNPYDKARALGNRLNPEAAPEQRRRTPADLRKLDQQIKEQRKKLKE